MTEVCRVRVTEVITETPDACSFVLAVPPEYADRFRYAPGQFITVRVPSERCESVARCYSLSSSPHTDAAPQITVKRTAGGYASNWLCDNVSAGTELTVLPPAGVFTPRSLGDDLLLLAGGSGITPVASIVKSALSSGSGRLVLVYANQDERSVILAGELRELSARYGTRLTVIHWLESLLGLPDAEQLRALLTPYAGYQTYLCGPAGFMDTARAALRELGVDRDRIHVEKFRSLSENPFLAAPAVTEPQEDRSPASVDVDLDGQQYALTWPAGTKLLDLMLDEGVPAPYSCREGACSACACRLVSGEVKMLNNEVLDQEDLDDGIILACQSLPVTDSVRISYE
ncbi:MAG: 2Fe-2S iron-sulfur cluster binding domain-containing protein [Pseudonocardiaceae bacterium]|nr:2Fe-2S iron-sulfur cluster binding domain-containing protein [Pseudonocardiaceae bacterium]